MNNNKTALLPYNTFEKIICNFIGNLILTPVIHAKILQQMFMINFI